MSSFSIVIITYNEAENIGRCIDSISSLSNDIVVVDAHSTDGTVEICRAKGVKLISKTWEGYGAAKNYGADQAMHDWIFSIDADELCSVTLAERLLSFDLNDKNMVYAVKRVNHIGQRQLRHSHLHPEWKPRLYNKTKYKWDSKKVHELLTPKPKVLIKVKAALNHFPAKSIKELEQTYVHYAKLQTERSKSYTPWRLKGHLSAIYHFTRSYFIMLGFLEGFLGYRLAIARSKAALIKYA